jgi:hypothetical protein
MPTSSAGTLRSGNVWLITASMSNSTIVGSSHLTSILSPSSQYDFTNNTALQNINRFASAIAGYQNYNTSNYTLTVNYIPC